MKRKFYLSFAAVVCAGLAVWAQSNVRYESQAGSKIRLDGTSTIHDWYAESGIVAGYIEAPTQLADTSKPVAVGTKLTPKLEVNIPVRSLKSSGKRPMDVVMHEAMNITKHPRIDYKLIDLTVKSVPAKAGDPYQLDATGALTVNGTTKTNQMVVTMTQPGNDKLKFTGTTGIKMTDFGIKPPAPSVGLGLIKTADDVKVTFEWLAEKKAAATAAAAK